MYGSDPFTYDFKAALSASDSAEVSNAAETPLHPKRCGPCADCREALADYAEIPAYAERLSQGSPLPSLPHTCADCGAYFKKGEAAALREHVRLCGAYSTPVYLEGTTFPWPYGHRQGERHPGDRADIWQLWVRQGRRGAAELIAKYGGGGEPSSGPVRPAPLRMLGEPEPPNLDQLIRHAERHGCECVYTMAEHVLPDHELATLGLELRKVAEAHPKARKPQSWWKDAVPSKLPKMLTKEEEAARLAEQSSIRSEQESRRKRSRRYKGVKEEILALHADQPQLMPKAIAAKLNISEARVKKVLAELAEAA